MLKPLSFPYLLTKAVLTSCLLNSSEIKQTKITCIEVTKKQFVTFGHQLSRGLYVFSSKLYSKASHLAKHLFHCCSGLHSGKTASSDPNSVGLADFCCISSSSTSGKHPNPFPSHTSSSSHRKVSPNHFPSAGQPFRYAFPQNLYDSDTEVFCASSSTHRPKHLKNVLHIPHRTPCSA